MPAIKKQYGPLSTILFPPDSGETPSLCVVLCHGFGAGGTDLVPLGFELRSMNATLSDQLQFVFPAARLSLDDQGMPGARAWWHIDMVALTEAISNGVLRLMRDEHPPELPAAREALLELIREIQEETGLPLSRFVLGGFSQGAMLATDVALHLPETVGALCVFSGTLLCETVWRPLAARHEKLRVLQSHGRHDMILPFEAARWLRDMFQDSGIHVEFIEFAGDHTIPAEALTQFAGLLEELA
jgi:phospholipase/carboxylesterase